MEVVLEEIGIIDEDKMGIEKELQVRSGGACELCSSKDELKVYEVPPVTTGGTDNSIMICQNCLNQIENPDKIDIKHWFCLNDSMWSEVVSVQMVAWRILDFLKTESWASDLLDMLYLDDDVLKLAKLGAIKKEEKIIHKDCNGSILEAGDSVSLTKDLVVKGSSMTAKRGTAVRRISLVSDNPEQIEGKIDGQQIVILTKFVKKV